MFFVKFKSYPFYIFIFFISLFFLDQLSYRDQFLQVLFFSKYSNKVSIVTVNYSLQTIGWEQTCSVSVVPSVCVRVVRKTIRHRVDFFLLLPCNSPAS